MSKRAILSVLLVLGMLSNGCATMFSGTTQSVSFTSDPDGATVTVTNTKNGKQMTGVSPCQIILKKSGEYMCEFELDGYQKQSVAIQKDIDALTFLNILTGVGIIVGFIVDASTGAINKINPTFYTVRLRPKQTVTPPPAPTPGSPQPSNM